jgi:DNA-binding MarR family transcriptional regulator
VAARDEVDELADAFVTAARALVAVAVRSINAAPVEITVPQHRVLVLLASRGEQSVGALAEQLGVNASNASRVCDRLQRLGLVARHRSPIDGRSVKVALTDDGVEVLRVVSEHRHEEVRRILTDVGLQEAGVALQALRDFNAAAGEVDAGDWLVIAGSVPRPGAVGP